MSNTALLLTIVIDLFQDELSYEKQILTPPSFSTNLEYMKIMISSQECIEMVTHYFEKVEALIKQNNIRYFGTIGTSYLNRWNRLIEFLEKRASCYLTFVN